MDELFDPEEELIKRVQEWLQHLDVSAGDNGPLDGTDRPGPGRCKGCREEQDLATPLLPAPCGHKYCANCLLGQIEASLAENIFRAPQYPPRCCGIPLDVEAAVGRGLIHPELLDGIREKEKELRLEEERQNQQQQKKKEEEEEEQQQQQEQEQQQQQQQQKQQEQEVCAEDAATITKEDDEQQEDRA